MAFQAQVPHQLAGPKATAALAKLLGLPIRSLCAVGEANVRIGLRGEGPALAF